MKEKIPKNNFFFHLNLSLVKEFSNCMKKILSGKFSSYNIVLTWIFLIFLRLDFPELFDFFEDFPVFISVVIAAQAIKIFERQFLEPDKKRTLGFDSFLEEIHGFNEWNFRIWTILDFITKKIIWSHLETPSKKEAWKLLAIFDVSESRTKDLWQ